MIGSTLIDLKMKRKCGQCLNNDAEICYAKSSFFYYSVIFVCYECAKKIIKKQKEVNN